MKILLTILLLGFAISVTAQTNLLANGSFEIQTSCPSGPFQIQRALYWTDANPAELPNNQCVCSHLFDSCATNSIYQVPNNQYGGGVSYDGSAYVGFYPLHFSFDNIHFKMYIQSEILTPLKTSVYYCFKMYIKRSDFTRWAINDFSVYFSQDKLQDTLAKVLDYIHPQITNTSGTYYTTTQEWKEYTGYFKADGGEKYLTIGSFLPIDSTPKISMGGTFDAAFYFIDNVQLYECGDSLNTAINENTIDSELSIFPNPTTGEFAVQLPNTMLPNAQLAVYNLTGGLVHSTTINNSTQHIALPPIANGVYYLRVSRNNSPIATRKLVMVGNH